LLILVIGIVYFVLSVNTYSVLERLCAVYVRLIVDLCQYSNNRPTLRLIKARMKLRAEKHVDVFIGTFNDIESLSRTSRSLIDYVSYNIWSSAR